MKKITNSLICLMLIATLLVALVPPAAAAGIVYSDLYSNNIFGNATTQEIQLGKTYNSTFVESITGNFKADPQRYFEINYTVAPQQPVLGYNILVRIPRVDEINENFTNVKFEYANKTLIQSYKVFSNETHGTFIVYPNSLGVVNNTRYNYTIYANFSEGATRTEYTGSLSLITTNTTTGNYQVGNNTSGTTYVYNNNTQYTDFIYLGGANTKTGGTFNISQNAYSGTTYLVRPILVQTDTTNGGQLQTYYSNLTLGESFVNGVNIFENDGPIYIEGKKTRQNGLNDNTTSLTISKLKIYESNEGISTSNFTFGTVNWTDAFNTGHVYKYFGTDENPTTYIQVNASPGVTYNGAYNGFRTETKGINAANRTQSYTSLVILYNSLVLEDMTVYRVGGDFPIDEQVTLEIPQGEFSSVNFTSRGGGNLNFSVNYYAHILDFEMEPEQTRGNIQFNFTPVSTAATYEYQISNNSNFTNILLNGTYSSTDIDYYGKINAHVVDINKLVPGDYFVKLKSSEQGNNTTFVVAPVTLVGDVSFTLKLVDGVTNEWINVSYANRSLNQLQFPTVNFQSGAVAQNVNYSATYNFLRYLTNNTTIIKITQNGISTNYSFENFTGDWYYASANIQNVSLGNPMTIQILSNYAGAWNNQTYEITPELYMFKNGELLLPIERVLSSGTTNTTHGLVISTNGQAVPNATMTVNNTTTGAFIGTYPVQDGGQYAYGNNTGATEFYYKFTAPGYATVEGVIQKGIKQDIIMKAAPNISIRVKDGNTSEDVKFFTTYLGENQTIRSTDTGVVVYENVTEGTYQVIVQADGYSQASRQINVTADDTEFTLFITKSSNQTTWDDVNYVRFIILDQYGSYVYNASVKITTESGSVVFDKYLNRTAAFTVEIDQTVNYVVVITKPSENISETINIYGSSTATTFYLYVTRTQTDVIPSLASATIISYNATPTTLTITAESTSSKIQSLYFKTANGTYYVTGTGEKGDLPTPKTTQYRNKITATFDLTGYGFETGGATVTAKVVVMSQETGNQEVSARKSMLVRTDHGILIDLGLDVDTRQALSIAGLFLLAIITASAGIPYLSTLIPIVGTVVLVWIGWMTVPLGVGILFAMGLMIIAWQLIKRSTG